MRWRAFVLFRSVFFFFLSFSLKWDPTGVTISKRYSFLIYGCSSSTVFLNISSDSPHKGCLCEFRNLKFHFLKGWIFLNIRECQFQNATPPTVMILFQPKFFWLLLVAVFIKGTYIGFWNLKFKKRLKFISGKTKNSQHLGNGYI